MSKKFCYLFTEGNAKMRELLGGKGANLAEMTNIGLPVPQGFTITTEACTQYYADNREINDEIKADIFKYMGILEAVSYTHLLVGVTNIVPVLGPFLGAVPGIVILLLESPWKRCV